MKKSTKKALIAVFILLMFGLSSIAFVATGLLGAPQEEFKPLESPIVEGELNPVYEATYVQNGFTWVKYYYSQPDTQFLSFMDSLPQTFPTPSGQSQIIVQKINRQYTNESDYIVVSSRAGQENFAEKDMSKLLDALCRLLTFTPFECSLANLTATNLTQ